MAVKSMMAALLAALAAALAAGCSKQEVPVLQVYNWSDYISPELIEQFEAENNCKVCVSPFDSNEAMYAKLKNGKDGNGYDICVPSSYQVEQMFADGMLEILDHSKLPDVKANFDHTYDGQVVDKELVCSVPYVVTYTGIIYAKDKVGDKPPKSWKAFAESHFTGKATMLDDIREVIGIGLMVNGHSLNSTSPEEISKAAETVIKLKKKSVRKFDAESYKTEVVSKSIWLGHGYSSDTAQAIWNDGEPRTDIGFVLPEEGFTVAWDELVILKSAKSKDLAYKFINFLYKTENAAKNMEYVCGLMPHKEAAKLIPQWHKDFFILKPEVLKQGQVMRSFVNDAKTLEAYNKAWDRIKSVEK